MQVSEPRLIEEGRAVERVFRRSFVRPVLVGPVGDRRELPEPSRESEDEPGRPEEPGAQTGVEPTASETRQEHRQPDRHDPRHPGHRLTDGRPGVGLPMPPLGVAHGGSVAPAGRVTVPRRPVVHRENKVS